MAFKLDYYHSRTDFIRYLFYRVPKVLFEAVEFRRVSFDARMFFIFLLDRASLSAQNGWVDETGRVYIIFTLAAAMRITGYGHNKMVRLFADLESAGLIERVRQGQGRPMKIYVKDLFHPMDEAGNPVEYETVPLSMYDAVLDGQMNLLTAMDAAEEEVIEMKLDTEDEPETPENLTAAISTETAFAAEPPEDDVAEAESPAWTAADRDACPLSASCCTLSAPCAESPTELGQDHVENSPAGPSYFDAADGSGSLLPSDMGKSGLPENGSQDFRKSEPNQTESNKNNFTKNPSYPPAPQMSGMTVHDAGNRHSRRRRSGDDWMEDMRNCREEVRLQIGFEELCAKGSMDIHVLRLFVDLIAGVLCSRKDLIRVNGELHPVAEVQARFMQLDREHIGYVLECLDKTATDIRNPRAYLLTALYNAPSTITAYYDAKVRHDMAQPSWYETHRLAS